MPRVLSALSAVPQIPVQIIKCPTAGPTIMGKDDPGLYTRYLPIMTWKDIPGLYWVYTKIPGISTSGDFRCVGHQQSSSEWFKLSLYTGIY